MKLPIVHFSAVQKSKVNWRKAKELEVDLDDDEELSKTPTDVLLMLGFDPLDIAGMKKGKK